MAKLEWKDFLQRYPDGHIVSVVLFPPRANHTFGVSATCSSS